MSIVLYCFDDGKGFEVYVLKNNGEIVSETDEVFEELGQAIKYFKALTTYMVKTRV